VKLKELLQRIQKNPEAGSIDLDHYLDSFVTEKLLKSETLQESFGINNEEMELLYYEAYQAYQSDKYQEAFELFRWLTILNTFEKNYWMGFAATCQMQEKFESALKAYAITYFLDTDSPYPHYHAYQCYLSMNNHQEAQTALLLAREKTGHNPLYQSLKNTIEQKLINLKQTLNALKVEK
jgi:type III secretion system low calcium response chaperone LcrH/SycD